MSHSSTKPSVSVVIATHRRPEMLRTALRSVLEQTYEGEIECVVVFDRAEPDHSLGMSEKGRSVTVLTNARTPGLAGARNTGIDHARGDVVAFCDDDDIWLPLKLERQMDGIAGAVAAVTGITIDYGGSTTDRVPRQRDFTMERLLRTRLMEAHPSTLLVRRDALLADIGHVDEDIPGSYGEDFDYMIRVLSAGHVFVAEEPLVVVRWGQSLFSRDWATIVSAIDYIVAKHEVLRKDDKALARLYGRRAFALAAMGERREALLGCVRTLRLSPTEKRAFVTLPVALGLVSAERLLDLAHRTGRGI